MRVGGVEHADAALVELEDQAVFRVHADVVAREAPIVREDGDLLTDPRGYGIM